MAGLSITSAAVRYQGAPYVWGGGGPYPRPGGDCSGFINWVLGHDLGMTLPGGIKGFRGQTHGPVVADYATWRGAVTVRTPEPGDLVIWYYPGIASGGHIGIVLGPDKMISSLDTQSGTVETPITGYGPSDSPFYRRVTGAAGGAAGGGIVGGVAGLAQRAGQFVSSGLGGGVALLLGGGVVAVLVGAGLLIVGGVVVAILVSAVRGGGGSVVRAD